MTLGFRPCPRIPTMFKCENNIALNALKKKKKKSVCVSLLLLNQKYMCVSMSGTLRVARYNLNKRGNASHIRHGAAYHELSS